MSFLMRYAFFLIQKKQQKNKKKTKKKQVNAHTFIFQKRFLYICLPVASTFILTEN